MSNLIVKIAYSGHVRRVTLSNVNDFTSIRSIIATTFTLPSSFTLTYVDDENDMCSIITQQEWNEAVRMYGQNDKTLKLYINDTMNSVDMVTDSTTTTAVNEVCDNLAATCFIIDEAQVPTSSSPSTETQAQDTKSIVSSHFLIPVDHLLQLLADPTFVTLIHQLVKTGITHFIETRSCVAAVDAITTILTTSTTFINHPSVVALTQHIHEIAIKRDEKMAQFKQHRRWAHQHGHGHGHGYRNSHKGHWAERRARIDGILTDASLKADRIPEFIPLVIATLTTLRTQVVAFGNLTPVSTAMTQLLAHPTIASILSTLGADATRVQRRIMKRVFGQGGGKGKGRGCGCGSWKKKHCHGSWKKKHGLGHRHGHGYGAHEPSINCSDIQPAEATPSTPSTDESVHRHVTCDMCGMSPITGIRYKCLDCPNYDLCSTCEMKTADDAHPTEHRLLKIKNPRHHGHGHGHGHGHRHAHGPFNWMMRHALRAHGCGRKMHMMEHHGHGHGHGHEDSQHHGNHHHRGHRYVHGPEHGHGFRGFMHLLRHTSLAEPSVNVKVNVAKSV